MKVGSQRSSYEWYLISEGVCGSREEKEVKRKVEKGAEEVNFDPSIGSNEDRLFNLTFLYPNQCFNFNWIIETTSLRPGVLEMNFGFIADVLWSKGMEIETLLQREEEGILLGVRLELS